MDPIAILAQAIGNLEGTVSTLSQTIQTAQADQRRDIGNLYTGINELKNQMSALPCSKHSDQIGKIEKWQGAQNGEKEKEKSEESKANWDLRNSLIVTGASLVSSGIGGVLVYWLTTGMRAGP